MFKRIESEREVSVPHLSLFALLLLSNFFKESFEMIEDSEIEEIQKNENIEKIEKIEKKIEKNGENVFKVSFLKLYETFSKTMRNDSSILLFYVFLSRNSHFFSYVISKTDQDTFIVNLLYRLYSILKKENFEDYSESIYMIIVLLLILSQGNKNKNKIKIKITKNKK